MKNARQPLFVRIQNANFSHPPSFLKHSYLRYKISYISRDNDAKGCIMECRAFIATEQNRHSDS